MKTSTRWISAAIVAAALSSSVLSAAPRDRSNRDLPPLVRLVRLVGHVFHISTLTDYPAPPKP